MRRYAIGIVLSVAVVLCSGCSMKVTNDGVNVASVPAGAWGVSFNSPNFEVNTSIDAGKTGAEIINIAKGLIDEMMGFPLLSQLGGLLEGAIGANVPTDGD